MRSIRRRRRVQWSTRSIAAFTRPQLVLAGGGHTHALVLLRWALQPEERPDAAITLVSRSPHTLYSGMLPGLVAGHYSLENCRIDLVALCLKAGVTWRQAEIEGLDPQARRLRLRQQPALAYERLSLDVGSITAADGGASGEPGGEGAMTVKPLEPFLAWCQKLQPGRPLRLRGGGATAVELALALRGRGHPCTLLLRGDSLQLGSTGANRAGERMLQRAGVALQRQVADHVPADLLCTGSRAPAWLAAAGLPVDAASGRVLSDPDLRVCGQPSLFVSGDCGLVREAPRPASGVWAVKTAPLLAGNLRRCLADPGAPLQRWRPLPWALQLLGDGSMGALSGSGGAASSEPALALWGPLHWGPNRWLGRCKQRIDRRFMARFRAVAP